MSSSNTPRVTRSSTKSSATVKPAKTSASTEPLSPSNNMERYNHLTTLQIAKILEGRVSKFSGEEEETFVCWLKRFVDILERFDIPKYKAQNLLPLYLSDSARIKYDSLSNPGEMDWEELVTKLAIKMKNPLLIQAAREELFEMRQGAETVGKFAKAIKTKADLAYQGTPTVQLEQMYIDFFIKGLRSDIKKTIRRLPTPSTFEEAINIAEREDRILMQERLEGIDKSERINALRFEDEIEEMRKQIQQLEMEKVREGKRTYNNRNSANRATKGRPSYANPPYNGGFQNAKRRFGEFFRGRPWNRGGTSSFHNNRQNYYRGRSNYPQHYGQPYHQYSPPLHQQHAHTSNTQSEEAYIRDLPTTSYGSRFIPTISSILTFCMLITTVCGGKEQYQICGFHEGGDLFIPPNLPTYHVLTAKDYLEEIQVVVYKQRNPYKWKAIKCSKEVTSIRIQGFPKVQLEPMEVNSTREAATDEECREALEKGVIHDRKLEEFKPHTRRTQPIETEIETTIWGVHKQTRIVYNVEYGYIYTKDGVKVNTELGDSSGCKITDGICKKDQYIIIWEKVRMEPICKYTIMGHYNAILTERYIAINGLDMVFELKHNNRSIDASRLCHIRNGYYTENGVILSFPQLEVHESIVNLANTRGVSTGRSKRAFIVRHDPEEGPVRFNLVEFMQEPIRKRIFGVEIGKEFPYFSTRPVRDSRILEEIKRWKVTNGMLQVRFNTYEKEDERVSVLRTIRYAEYRERQILNMMQVRNNRALTAAENRIIRDLESWTIDYFDNYLEREFGPLKVVVDHERLEKGTGPYFQEGYITTKAQQTDIRKSVPKPAPDKPKRIPTGTIATVTNRVEAVKSETSETKPDRFTPEMVKYNKQLGIVNTFNTIFTSYYTRILISKALLRVDTAMAARILFNRDDISAKFVGESLLVAECKQVIPSKIHWSRRINDTCYMLTPVEVEDENWFLLPGTRDLVESSELEECGEKPFAVVNDNGVWKTEKGEVEINHIPMENNNKKTQVEISQVHGQRIFYRNNPQHASIIQLPYWTDKLKKGWEEYPSIGNHITREAKKFKEAVDKSLSSAYERAAGNIEGIKEQVKQKLRTYAWKLIAVPLILLILLTVLYCSIKSYCFWKTRRITKDVIAMSRKASPIFLKRMRKQLLKEMVNNVCIEEPEIEMMEIDKGTVLKEERYFIPEIYSVICNIRGRHNELPFIEISINGKRYNALVDSGASVSYLGTTTLKNIGVSKLESKEQVQARTANGAGFIFLASVKLEVQIGRYQYKHVFRISKDDACPAPILLGSDFIKAINQAGQTLTMDLVNRTIQIGKETSPLVEINAIKQDINNVTNNKFKVRLSETLILERRTEAIIPVRIEAHCAGRQVSYLIEDNNREDDQIYVIGRSLVTPNDYGETMVIIMNPSNANIKLYRNTYVADATQVEKDHQIYAVNTEKIYVSPEALWEQRLPKFQQSEQPEFDICTEIDLRTAKLTEEQKERLRNIIRKHKKAFVGPDGALGRYIGPIRHRIDLIENAKIPAAKIYRVPPEKKKEIEKQINQMLKDNIIRESSSPFCAPIVLVKKADKKSWRFTTDFRALNAITKPTQSILPNIHDILDACAGKKYYTTMDFQAGFHQIPLEESHCERTAFACFLGAYEYITMPMGLMGAPGTFQKIMNGLAKQIRARVFIYIDDLVITSKTVEEHLSDVEEVLSNIEKIGMKLKPSKCLFAQQEVKFLGFILSEQGIRPNPEKTWAIDKYPTPENANDVRAFIGMTSFFRRFIPKYAQVAAALVELTKKDVLFIWSDKCEEAFRRLKTAITTAPILSPPKLGQPYIIETDASGLGVGAVLKQEQENVQKVIAYTSRALNKHESRYPAIELEALGIIVALQKFRPYIDGAKCTVITDHSPLRALLHRKDLTGRLARYQIVLQEYDIDIIYRPGKKNLVADALSRHLPEESYEPQIASIWEDDLLRKRIDVEEIAREQKECPKIHELKEMIKNTPQELGNHRLENYAIIGDVLHKIPEKVSKNPQIILPEQSELKFKIIKDIHESMFGAAHLGVNKTKSIISNTVIWNGMGKDIAIAIKHCESCQRRKNPSAYRNYEPMRTFDTPKCPMQRLHADFLGPLPLTLRGNRYIFVIMDAFTKYAVVEALPDQKSHTTIKTLVDRLIARFGVPENLVTDQGSNFTSNLFRNAMKLLGINHIMSTPYHHQTNGLVERFNLTLEQLMSHVTSVQCDDWDEGLQLITHAYNTSEGATTQTSPFYLTYGRQPNSPFTIAMKAPIRKYRDEEDYIAELTENLQAAWKVNNKVINEVQGKQKKHYDLRNHARTSNFKVGDKVVIRTNRANKLMPLFSEPHEVVSIEHPNLTLKTRQGKLKTMHANQVRYFYA